MNTPLNFRALILKNKIYIGASCILKMHLTGNPVVIMTENGIVIYMDRHMTKRGVIWK